MTNFTAILLITATTNWVSIGTFTPNNGSPQTVEQLQVVTNHVLHVEYRYTTQEFFLGKDMGPVLKERKVDIPLTITNYGGDVIIPSYATNTFPRSDR